MAEATQTEFSPMVTHELPKSVVEQLIESDIIALGPEYEGKDICIGADPFIFYRDGMLNLLLQEDLSADPTTHEGINGYTLRRSPRISYVAYAPAEPIQSIPVEQRRTQSWAAEIYGNHMYVAHSTNGENETHRMYVYETEGSMVGPWRELGELQAPKDDDKWAIDLMFTPPISFNGEEKEYAIWSGWENEHDGFPQNLYIAEKISPTEIGPRRLLAKPDAAWSNSVKPILEGPQALVLDGEFQGITVTGNASWTDKYATSVMKYVGGDPMDSSSWRMADEPLFPAGKGIGHGIIVQEDEDVYFVGHRKTSRKDGWEDRSVFYTKLDRDHLNKYLKAI